MKIMSIGMELTIVKWTFIAVFGGITLLFAAKIAALLHMYTVAKFAAFKLWLASPDFAKEIGTALWKAVMGGN